MKGRLFNIFNVLQNRVVCRLEDFEKKGPMGFGGLKFAFFLLILSSVFVKGILFWDLP